MKKDNTLTITILDPVHAMQQMLEDARNLDKGNALSRPNKLIFSTLDQLLASLSEKRWELINRLSKENPISIKHLASLVSRDYSNVHADVQKLKENGLIESTSDNKFLFLGRTLIFE